MAEPISIQQLKDASLDVKSLEEAVNGDENVVVTTRLGETYPSVKGSIKKVFENGGLPAEPFATKALMTASALVDGDFAMVTDDMVNNGLYVKTAGAWVKSTYDVVAMTKSAVDESLFDLTPSVNIFDKSTVVNGAYVGSDGNIYSASGWSHSDFIPVVAGENYTVSSISREAGLVFFNLKSTGSPITISYNSSPDSVTITAPVGANYMVINYESPYNTTPKNVQVQKGSVVKPYEPFGVSRTIKPDLLLKIGETKPGEATIEPSSGQLTIDAGEVKLTVRAGSPISHYQSSVFNFIQDEFEGVITRYPNDDAAPLRIDNTDIGGNHGYYQSVITTTAAHGKTDADVGSTWSDSISEYVILFIESATVLSVTQKIANSTLPSGTAQLTHITGAANTAAIMVSSINSRQMYPVIKNHKITTIIDGKVQTTAITEKKTYSKNVTFHETYEVMAKNDLVAWLIANKGVAHASYDAIGSAFVENSYVFDVDAGCTIYSSLSSLKSVPFADWMMTQSSRLNDDSRKYYVPKSEPFTQDAVSYDFRSPRSMPVTALPSNRLLFTPATNDPLANPVDRLVQTTSNFGYATGFLPVLDAEPSKRLVNASDLYFEVVHTSLKVYPRLIDNSKTTLEVGDNYSAIAYRKYFKRDNKRTAKYLVRSTDADYLYLDWHTATTDTITLYDELIGRSFEVHEQSSNVTILSKFATDSITVRVDNSEPFGYLVLRFDK